MASEFPGIVTFNDPYHDSSFCLCLPTGIVHVEVERLSRLKYDSQNPLAAFSDMYLDRMSDVSVVGIEEGDNLAPLIRHIVAAKGVPDDDQELAQLITSGPAVRNHHTPELRPVTIGRIRNLLQYLVANTPKIHFVGHHEAHAANAFHSSDCDEALVITLDGGGFDFCKNSSGQTVRREIYGAVYGYSGRKSKLVEQVVDISFGLAWFRAVDLLGLQWGEEGTVMAMATLGDPSRFADVFAQRFIWEPNSIRLENAASAALGQFLSQLRQQLRTEQDQYDFAAALQWATERNVERYLRRFITSDVANLCVAGGVFLNCQLLGKLHQWFPHLATVFIPPAPYDGGISIGIAQKIMHEILGVERDAIFSGMTPFAMGRRYSAGEVRAACHRVGIGARSVRIEELIDLIEQGQIVAIFSGAAESGRRALGNRSIVGDPRRAEIKSRINGQIKHRQWFRPLAPSVLAEHVAEWFTCPPSFMSPYMSFAIPVREARRDTIPAVVHLDGTARVQTVHSELSPVMSALLKAWHARTGVPILINTSFNDREPIVETPDDALRTFRQVPIDVLYFADFGLAVSRLQDCDISRADPDSLMNTVASRLGGLIRQCLRLRSEVLASAFAPVLVADRLHELFTDAKPTGMTVLEPYQKVAVDIWVGFQPTAEVGLTIARKNADVSSPDIFLNTVSIAFTGQSVFLSLEASVAWSELCDADRFQIALRAEPNRPVSCNAVLRVCRCDRTPLDLELARFSLQPGRCVVNKFGTLSVRDIIDIDPSRNPIVILFFDTMGPLNLRFDYINLYFR